MNLTEHFRQIKAAYDQMLPEWMEDYEATGNMWNDPYLMDWQFSPIESLVWGDIREMAMPFYPQMPVLTYFLDFGNPFLKIGIECDGKAWHDKERDKIRDDRLAGAGWMIFRIEGHECVRQVDTVWTGWEEDRPPLDAARYFGMTSEGVLEAIKNRYFSDEPATEHAFWEDATLFNHRSTPETRPVRRPLNQRNDGPQRLDELLANYMALLERRMQRARLAG